MSRVKGAPAAGRGATHADGARWHGAWSRVAQLRLAWAVFSVLAVQSVIFGLSVLPAALFYQWHLRWHLEPQWLRVVVLAMAFLPAYLLFAVAFMWLSATAMELHGWRTPDAAELRIADLEWPLLDWGRYMISIHLVGIFAGTFLKSTPLWSWYLRRNGARLGRGVFVNSLALTDHCLLDFADGVVIGSDVHLSGHTVERGLVKTAGVRLGRGVVVGVGAVVDIGVQVGEGTQIGALSVVPKHSVLDAHSTYVGIPAHKLASARGSPEL